ncbi:MAG: GNAT family N-acyltransferase [Flavobacteriaceae bacterium]
MSLVRPKQMAKALNLDKFGPFGTAMSYVLMRVLGLQQLNKIYKDHKHEKGLNFLDGVLEDLQIDFDIPKEDLERIPKEGPFITVSNHPLGGIDGILLLKLILEQRSDFKIIANFILNRIVPLRPYIMPVNPFENRKDLKSSVAGIKAALGHLKEGKPLGIFPAGEVSTYKDGNLRVDKQWESGAIRIIQKAKVPVIPIYFHAKNSGLFYRLAEMSETLRTAKLPSELLTQKRRTIKVRIGRPIQAKELEAYENLEDLNGFLRAKTYILSKVYNQKIRKFIRPTFKFPKMPKEIIDPISPLEIQMEVDDLRIQGDRLFENKTYEVFLAKSEDIPNLLIEIGRLREVTFRAVGEGSNKSLDLDQYDTYYRHLFLWDKQANRFVGAYRMGFGNEILPKFGMAGFYINELFEFDKAMYPVMQESLEMGRAFIVEEYQQKALPLFLLWRGIAHVIVRNPNLKYLCGGVSISNDFSDFSKSLMIDFVKQHHYDEDFAQHIKPRKEFKVKLDAKDRDFVEDKTKADLNKFDQLISELEPGMLRVPVLLKKYIKQNAKIAAFNVDPKFNNVVDGLIFMRVSDLPESTLKPVLEEINQVIEKQDH